MNNTTISTNYEQQAQDFLTSTGASIEITYLKNDFHFVGDKDKRDIYTVTIKRGNRKFTFNFGQSIDKSQYYQDSIKGRTYTLNGGSRTGGYKINDIEKYKSAQTMKLIKGQAPTSYDVLACLQKYDVGTFEDFCGEFGYDTDSKTAEKTYKAVVNEYTNVCKLFTDAEIEQLQEIQ